MSSSGHLALGKSVMGLEAGGMALDVALHVGTLGAILWAFRKDVFALLRDPFEGRYLSWVWLVVATLPVAVIGIVFKDSISAAAGTAVAAGCGPCHPPRRPGGEFNRRRFDALASPADGPPVFRMRDAVVMGLPRPPPSGPASTVGVHHRGGPGTRARRRTPRGFVPHEHPGHLGGCRGAPAPQEGFGNLNGVVVFGATIFALVG